MKSANQLFSSPAESVICKDISNVNNTEARPENVGPRYPATVPYAFPTLPLRSATDICIAGAGAAL